MKRFLSFLLILVLSSLALFSAFDAISRDGLKILHAAEEGSAEELAIKALKSDVSLSWYDEYTTAEKVLIESTYKSLAEILPLDNFVISEKKNDAIRVYSSDGTIIDISFKENRISSISVL